MWKRLVRVLAGDTRSTISRFIDLNRIQWLATLLPHTDKCKWG